MAIRMVTTTHEVDEYFRKAAEIVEEEAGNELAAFGAECEERIRNRSAEESWHDVSGNLRSSVGYVVAKEGKVWAMSAFNAVGGGTLGSSKGRAMAGRLAASYTDMFILAVFAAMEYADEVERLDNRDVLASAILWARSEMTGRLQKAMERAAERINRL